MTDKLTDLKPNRSLIDAHFDGYKLSLDPLATYQVTIESGRSLITGNNVVDNADNAWFTYFIAMM